MKRFFAVLCVVVMFVSLCWRPEVSAASNTYDLDALKLQVSIPEEYYVLTRDTPASDPAFSVCGSSKTEMNRLFINSGIYLNAFPGSLQEEIVVTMSEVSMTNFTLLGDVALEALISALVKEFVSYGIHVSSYEVYGHSQAKFVKLFFTDTAKTVHGLQYYTVYNGKAMNFTMRSYKGSLSAAQKATIQNVVDSIRFDEAPPVLPTEETPAFTYRDTDAGVEFTVPKNWKREEFTKDREYIDEMWASTKTVGYSIIYGSADMWAEIPASERVGLTRQEVNDAYFTDAEIASMYGIKSNEVFSKYYNGTHYYKMELPLSSSQYGMEFDVTMTMLVHLENGWMYIFQFGGKSTDPMYKDFESLMKTVKYPQAASVPQPAAPSSKPSTQADPLPEVSPVLWIVLAVIAVVVIVIVVCRRKKAEEFPVCSDDSALPPLYIRQAASGDGQWKCSCGRLHQRYVSSCVCGTSKQDVLHAQEETAQAAPESPSEPKPVFCGKCGFRLLEDSRFCSRCGEPISQDGSNGS